jgi:hypothetical protein
MKAMSEYEVQAEKFLNRFGLKFRATMKNIKNPPWDDKEIGLHGDHYRVTISRKGGGRITFDFWGSVADMQAGKKPTAYGVLACISGDVYCPESFYEFCGEYGYDIDSRKAESQFRRCNAFAKRLRSFFSKDEQEALAEIR